MAPKISKAYYWLIKIRLNDIRLYRLYSFMFNYHKLKDLLYLIIFKNNACYFIAKIYIHNNFKNNSYIKQSVI